jgi:predicted alpha/beta hydrolase family esterase
MLDLSFVFLAGSGNSEPTHWQRLWCKDLARTSPVLWVEHENWTRVARNRWLSELDAALDGMAPGPDVVFVAHSLGCHLAAEWLDENPDSNVAAVFFAAPPDLAGECAQKDIAGFRTPFETSRIRCDGVVVASEDDPYATLDYARRAAAHWNLPLVDVGKKGHINLASGLGAWPEGRELLTSLVAKRTAR